MSGLTENERSGAVVMPKPGVLVPDVVGYHNCHLPTIQRLKDRCQATGTVKDRRRFVQPRMATFI